jgi:hypothetical protein
VALVELPGRIPPPGALRCSHVHYLGPGNRDEEHVATMAASTCGLAIACRFPASGRGRPTRPGRRSLGRPRRCGPRRGSPGGRRRALGGVPFPPCRSAGSFPAQESNDTERPARLHRGDSRRPAGSTTRLINLRETSTPGRKVRCQLPPLDSPRSSPPHPHLQLRTAGLPSNPGNPAGNRGGD